MDYISYSYQKLETPIPIAASHAPVAYPTTHENLDWNRSPANSSPLEFIDFNWERGAISGTGYILSDVFTILINGENNEQILSAAIFVYSGNE